MKTGLTENGTWYHGSNAAFAILRQGSTITQWRQLAEAFSHKPTILSYDSSGKIDHNGVESGYLYTVDEPIQTGVDIIPHPNTSMVQNMEFITLRPLRVRLIAYL